MSTPTFKDTEGREWTIKINPHTFGRVRETLKIDLYACIENGFAGYAKLMSDPPMFASVVFLCVEDQAEKRNIDAKQFGMAISGDVLDDMEAAFMQALIFFSPKSQRAALQERAAKGREIVEKIGQTNLETMRAVDVELVVATLKSQSGNSPASSE